MKIDDDFDVEFVRQLLHETVKILCDNIPTMKEISMDVLETIFTPKAVIKQLILVTAIESTVLTISQIKSIIQSIITIQFPSLSKKRKQITELSKKQNSVETQDEWMDIAEKIDYIQGNDVWRSDPDCFLYERERISGRVDEFIHLMRRRDLFDLMFTLRGGIGRNKFGLLHEGLFSKAQAGSKVLVETYHNVVCAALDYVCDAPVPPTDDPIPTDARLAFFNETRHSYGRTALLLSGGAALGFYHIGVVKALMENDLLPRVIGGASAGSILAAVIATRTDDEFFNDLCEMKGTVAPGHSGFINFHFFRSISTSSSKTSKDPRLTTDLGDISEVLQKDVKLTAQAFVPIGLRWMSSTLWDIMTGARRPQDLLKQDTNHFRDCVRLNVGEFTFQEAFDRTGRILNITVTPKNRSDPPRLLNYLTAPHVLIWSAVVCSSSLPGVFEANKLVVKDADGTTRYESLQTGQVFSDGSMEADLPMTQLSEMFNVNHFIISQANPHAVMFAGYNMNRSIWGNAIVGAGQSILLFLKDQLRTWLRHVVELVGGRRYAPMFDTSRGFMSTFFTQEYEGRNCDISLIPWLNHRSLFSALLHLVYNPNDDEIREWTLAAEREVWKHIPAIKSHCAEEMTLDSCVQRLRKRLIAESYEKAAAAAQGMNVTNGGTFAQRGVERVPSFFTSRSIVNMSGLGIHDQTNIDAENLESNRALPHGDDVVVNLPEVARVRSPSPLPASGGQHVEYYPGWGGQGLHGCHSLTRLRNASISSLNRSEHSGLFLDDLEEEPTTNNTANATTTNTSNTSTASGNSSQPTQQVPGEQSTAFRSSTVTVNTNNLSMSKSVDELEEKLDEAGYVKTTSMANFYYRRTGSYDQLEFSGGNGGGRGRGMVRDDEHSSSFASFKRTSTSDSKLNSAAGEEK